MTARTLSLSLSSHYSRHCHPGCTWSRAGDTPLSFLILSLEGKKHSPGFALQQAGYLVPLQHKRQPVAHDDHAPVGGEATRFYGPHGDVAYSIAVYGSRGSVKVGSARRNVCDGRGSLEHGRPCPRGTSCVTCVQRVETRRRERCGSFILRLSRYLRYRSARVRPIAFRGRDFRRRGGLLSLLAGVHGSPAFYPAPVYEYARKERAREKERERKKNEGEK